MDQTGLDLYRDVFIQRHDAYARQRATAASPDRHTAYVCVRQPVTDAVLADHLAGRITAAWYALDSAGRCRWGAYDCDDANPAGLVQLQRLARALDAWGMTTLLEASRRGGHLWVLVAPPGCAAADLRVLLYRVLEDARMPASSRIEVYPKQSTLPPGGFGSSLRGPLGVHQGANGHRFPFLDPETLDPVGHTLRAQLSYLARRAAARPLPEAIHAMAAVLPPPAALCGVDARRSAPMPTTVHRGPAAYVAPSRASPHAWTKEPDACPAEMVLPTTPLSPEMAATISVPQLALLVRQRVDLRAQVARYTSIAAGGRAHCPIHPPDVHPSFVIRGSGPDAFWICFHETNPTTGRYLGGDVVDFYARMRGLHYAGAAWELAATHGILPSNIPVPARYRFHQRRRPVVRLWRVPPGPGHR